MRPHLLLLAALLGCDVELREALNVHVYATTPDECTGVAPHVAEAVDAWAEHVPIAFTGCTPGSDHARTVTATEDAAGMFDPATGLQGLELHDGPELPAFVVDGITAHYGDGRTDELNGLGVAHECGHAIALVGTRSRTALAAHELGHVLGLDHDTRPGNLMHPSAPDAWWLDDAQLETATEDAAG